MNAPANIRPDHPQKERDPAWARYLPTVDSLCPGATDEERRDHAGIMLLRDLAALGQQSVGWEAAQALVTVEHLAQTHALTPLPADDLRGLRLALARIYYAARDLEGVFARHGRG
jgi:hypothetical protein